jgi:thiamine transport system substrate-binding protein
MKSGFFSSFQQFAVTLGLGLLFSFGPLAVPALAQTPATQELRVLVHSSFSLPKPLLAQFELESGVKLSVIKGGDAGEMLNKLVLTQAQPIADVVYGVDNALVAKALAANLLEPYAGAAAQRRSAVALAGLVPVDYGYVTLNIDRAWFAKSGLAPPKSLDDLALPAYKDLLVVQHPATSSPGYAFMLATVAGLGEEKAFEWWAAMRANGLKVAKGWTEAYYTDFSRNGGARPIVVSYATSPAAEVFYSKVKISEPPTASLSLKGGVFRQVEGVALVRGGVQNAAQRDAAGKFIEFLRSPAAQTALQTSMWMYPVESDAPRVEAMRHAPEPAAFDNPTPELIAQKGAQWVERWTRVVLR